MSDVTSTSSKPLIDVAAQQYIEQRLGFAWDELLRFPKFIDIETVNMCNARCTMCGIDFSSRLKQQGTMLIDDELFRTIVGQLSDHVEHVQRVGLILNNEPLMDPGLEHKIETLKRRHVRETFVNTNASLLTSERSASLLKAGLDRMYISIDSMDPRTFERIRRGLIFDEVHSNTLEFIRHRNLLRPETIIRVVMIQQEANRHEVDSFKRYWRSKLESYDQVVVSRVYDWGTVQNLTPDEDVDLINKTPCIALWSTMEIDTSGNVILCCADQGANVVLGNVTSQSLFDIWHGQRLAEYREMHLSGRRCEIALCDGCGVWRDDKHLVPLEADSDPS